MQEDSMHIPVMLNEVIANLAPVAGDIIVDGTFGMGGYSRAFLEQSECIVYAIDRDPDAIVRSASLKAYYPERFFILHGCFGDMKKLLQNAGVEKVNGVVLDLGVSSPQLDERERGFSFREDGPLDMRMSQDGTSAKDLVNTLGHGELAHIIKHYGEEKMAGKVASAILRHREEAPIETTGQLAEIIRSVVYKGKSKIDPATRTFQAIRIAVNDELGEVERALDASTDVLDDAGRLVVVSFHSLEDRIVKKFIKKETIQDGGNRHLPMQVETHNDFKVGTKGVIKCTEKESQINPRSRSAKLRMAIRIR